MPGRRFFFLATVLVLVSGCTEMRVEGDAKTFQSSAVGTIIQTVIGIGLLGLGAVAVAGSVMPDRKPRGRKALPHERVSAAQRVGLALFGGAMGLIGLFLAASSFVFPNKLHVTVYPDRVAMASTYSQTGGKELVIPFSEIASVEIRDEPNVVGKFKKFIVFTTNRGSTIKQAASNNEMRAIDTIRQALADYQTGQPSIAAKPQTTTERPQPAFTPPRATAATTTTPSKTTPSQSTPKPTPSSPEYSLQRYVINIAIPEGYSVVGPDTVVEVGTKLGACYASRWETVTVVAINDDGTITCNWDNWKSYTYRMMREDLTIATPGTSATTPPVTSRLDSTPKSTPSSPEYSLKRYLINIALPEGYSVVGPDMDVEVGTKLGACYANRWEAVTVVAINDDGTITCNWDKWRSFTYRMMREDLIIANGAGESTRSRE